MNLIARNAPGLVAVGFGFIAQVDQIAQVVRLAGIIKADGIKNGKLRDRIVDQGLARRQPDRGIADPDLIKVG